MKEQLKTWIKLEKDYRKWVQGYNKAKETYFALESERLLREKALSAARSDYTSAVIDHYIAPKREK